MKRLFTNIFFALFILSSFAAAAEDNSQDELGALLSLDRDSASGTDSLPYSVNCTQESMDKIKCVISTDDGAYIYKDSIKAECRDGIAVLAPLAQGTVHSDPNGEYETYEGSHTFYVNLIEVKKGSRLSVTYRGCSSDGICFPEGAEEIVIKDDYTLDKGRAVPYETASSENEESGLFGSGDNFLLLLSLALLLGAALDLTPCVFPMLTIYSATILGGAYVSKAHSLRLNLCYLAGLALTYCSAGIIFSEIGVAAHSVLQHPLCVCLMALALTLFALDCMGLIAIRVPALFNNSLQNTINERKAGSAGKAFVFGALSALITTPCTSAPLAGALIYVMNTNSLIKGSLLFLALGIGMGVPLVLIGFFGSRFLSGFKGKGSVVRKLLAVPLLIAAVYITEHLFSDYAAAVWSAVYALSAAYAVYVLKDLLRLKAPVLFSALAFFIVFNLAYKAQDTVKLPFESLENAAVLDNYRGRKVLLTIAADWCSNCHALDRALYATDDFVRAMEGVVLLRYDFTNPDSAASKEMIKRFRLIGVPFAAVIDENQKIVKTFTGGVSLEELKEALNTRQ